MHLEPATLVFELVNFVVLTWLLTRFVYRPIARAIEARRRELATLRETTAARLAEVEARQVELDRRDAELDRLRERIVQEAGSEAAAERARLLAQARDDAAAERERVQALLDAEREAALAWVREVAVDQGATVAGQMLLGLVPEAAHAALLARLCGAVDEEAGRLRGTDVEEVELAVARMPETGELDALRAALERALGRRPRLHVEEDERLGAGGVLRVGDRVLDASVAGQLELVRQDARRHLEAGA